MESGENYKAKCLWKRGEIAVKTIDRLKSRLQSRAAKGSRRPDVEKQLFREVLAMIADIQDRLGWTENFNEMRRLDGITSASLQGQTAYEPTEEEIRESCDRLQSSWTESERRARAPHLVEDGNPIKEHVPVLIG